MGFLKFLNEFELEGDKIESKPLWNGKDYLDRDGDISLSNMNLTELPCVFPEKWGRGFYCYQNQLTSLIGAPKEVGSTFDCSGNQLTSLEGAPKEVGGGFYCSHNQLTSLEGAPKEVGGSFWCEGNQVEFTEDDIRKVCDVKGNIYV